MAYLVGADPAQLDALAARMAAAAERLESIRTGIGASLAHSHWDGRDADDFGHLWHHQLAPRLYNVAAMTRAGATTVRANAQQQRDASGLGTSGGDRSGRGDNAQRSQSLWQLRTCPIPTDRRLLDLDVLDISSWLVDIRSRLGNAFDLAGRVRGFQDNVHLPEELRDIGRRVDDLFESHPSLERMGELVKWMKGPLGPLSLLLDGHTLVEEWSRDPGSAESFNAAAHVVFSAAVVGLTVAAAVAGAPVLGTAAGVVGVMSVAFSVVEWIAPELPQKIGEGVLHAAENTWNGVSHGVESLVEGVSDAVDDVKDAASASTHVVTGGWNAVSNWFK